MKIIILFFLFFTVFRFSTKADTTINEPVTIPTPNTTALMQYGIIPMSLYTGKANVSIPLYDCTLRGVNLNASLLYDTSGLLVNSLPSWTGHSWTLQVGGVITRAVKGREDEFDKTNHNLVAIDLWQNYFHRYNSNVNDYDEGFGDYMPDIFYFSFMGKSGKFFLGNDGEWKVASDDNLMVEFDINNPDNYITPFIEVLPNKNYRQPKSIKGFTMIDQEGNRYVFGGNKEQNASEYSIDLRQDNDGVTGRCANGEMYANSWYLTAVYDRYGMKIYDFKYKRGLFLITSSVCYQQTLPQMMINSPVYLEKITAYDGTTIDFIQDSKIFTSTDFYYRLYHGKSLSTMFRELSACQMGDNWYRPFIYLRDNDYSAYQNPDNTNKEEDPLKSMGMSALKEIRISNQGVLCQKYIFNYNYGDNIRLHLNSIEIHDCNDAIDGMYRFRYNQFERLPTIGGHCDYLSPSSDDWGYYNGATDGSKNVNPTFSQFGMLKEIQYPTGGVTTFEYENHRYESVRNPFHDGMIPAITLSYSNGSSSLLAGGLRISSIVNYEDVNKNDVLSERFYSYYNGQLASFPGTLFLYDSYATGTFYPHLPIPLANVFGYHIGYSKVVEAISGENEDSEQLYQYSNFSDYKEESCLSALEKYKNDNSMAAFIKTLIAQYDEWTTRDYMRGKLLHYAKRSEDECEWYSVTYTYRTDSLEREKNYVTGYMDMSLSKFGGNYSEKKGPCPYRLFYSKYDVVKKTEQTQYHWTDKRITDTTTYTMSDYTVNLSSGYSHKGEMRLCDSETRSRLGNTIRYDYKYQLSKYYAPVVSTREYRNGTFVKDTQVDYGYFYVNKRFVRMPKIVKEVYPLLGTSTLKTYVRYNKAYLPSEYTDEMHRTVKLNWDSCDRLLSCTMGGQTTSCEYNGYGQVSRIIQPNGYELNYEYDGMQRLSGIRDKEGNYLEKHKYAYRTSNHE